MSDPKVLLDRYLRQRRELGESELVFLGEPLRALAAASAAAAGDSPTDAAARPVAAPPPPMNAVAAPPSALDVIRESASVCTRCRLAGTRSTVVFGDGDPGAKLVVVGEAPGAEEDRSGRPFVGRAGKLLDLLLASVGFPRETVYICNVLKCRPPGNRNPLPDEVEMCSPFLQKQLDLIGPSAILACGSFSAQTLLATTEAIGQIRKREQSYQGIPLVATYHPAALLRNPAWIRPVWEDLQRLRRIVDAAGETTPSAPLAPLPS
jgi:uracil-DNA glycosylase